MEYEELFAGIKIQRPLPELVRLEAGGTIVQSHQEAIEGEEITVIDELALTHISGNTPD